MDILWGLLTLPYAPVRGLTVVVKVIVREADLQQHNPVNIRRELEELDRAAAAGDITRRERDLGQQQILDRLAGAGGGEPRGAGGARRPARRAGRPAGSGRRRAVGRSRRADRPDEPDRGRGR